MKKPEKSDGVQSIESPARSASLYRKRIGRLKFGRSAPVNTRPVRIGQHSGATSAAAESTTHGTRALCTLPVC